MKIASSFVVLIGFIVAASLQAQESQPAVTNAPAKAALGLPLDRTAYFIGEKVPLARKSWTQGGRGAEARWFKYLEAHEYHKASVNMADYYDFEKGEQYRVTVEYDNQESGYNKGGWIEMCAWVGRIKSNKLLLK